MANSVIGLLFYAAMFVLAFFGYTDLVYFMAIGSLFVSAGLAYILYAKVKSLCLICTTIYVINIALFITTKYGW